MSAFATGLRTLFNDPNMSVCGIYTPAGGSPMSVRVMFVESTDAVIGGAALMGTTATQDAAELLQSEVPDKPTRGATLAFKGKTYAIRSPGTEQKRGLTWRVVLANG